MDLSDPKLTKSNDQKLFLYIYIYVTFNNYCILRLTLYLGTALPVPEDLHFVDDNHVNGE